MADGSGDARMGGSGPAGHRHAGVVALTSMPITPPLRIRPTGEAIVVEDALVDIGEREAVIRAQG